MKCFGHLNFLHFSFYHLVGIEDELHGRLEPTEGLRVSYQFSNDRDTLLQNDDEFQDFCCFADVDLLLVQPLHLD